MIPGTNLAAYGHGDWNDSLQPVDPAMCERLCSAWTVMLHHHTLVCLAKALRQVGRLATVETLEASAQRVKDDLTTRLSLGERPVFAPESVGVAQG